MYSEYTTNYDIEYITGGRGGSSGRGGFGANASSVNTRNGRIDIEENKDIVFKMQERIAIKNKATDYSGALNGSLETTPLSRAFFSAKNIQILQNGIRAGVYSMSGNRYVIGIPNIETLQIIMRSTFLNYAEHDPNNIRQQIEKLNKIVLDYAVPDTYNAAISYEKYLEDQTTLVVPLETPQQPDRNVKQLELKPFF